MPNKSLFLGLLLPFIFLSLSQDEPLSLRSSPLPSIYLPTEPSYTGLLATSFVTKGRDPASQLLLAAQFICKETGPGPGNYLLKLIVRQYGFTFLRRLVKNHPWVVPSSLRWTGEVKLEV